MSNLGDIGEIGLIQMIKQKIESSPLVNTPPVGFELFVGVGDDAAIWRPTNGAYYVQTTDTLVEGVHFSRNTFTWNDVGWKLAAVNLSDLAAMGADPAAALITLGLSPDLDMEMVDGLYDGILECFSSYSGQIIGGDIVRSDQLFMTMSLIGQSDTFPMSRKSASVGDVVAVTGNLGSSAAGLSVLKSGDKQQFSGLAHAHLRPDPQIRMGKLIRNSGIDCAIDISDGLLSDLAKIGLASEVEIHIEASLVPFDNVLIDKDWPNLTKLIFTGGEDYQLAFTGKEELVRELLQGSTGAIIGQVREGKPGHVKIFSKSGEEINFDRPGWDHLLI